MLRTQTNGHWGGKKFFCQKPFAETYSHPKTLATYNELIL